MSQAQPIAFYPGELIGEPQSDAASSSEVIYQSTSGPFQITMAKLVVSLTNQQSLTELVLLGGSMNQKYALQGGTIIILGSEGEYLSAETDVYYQNETLAHGTVVTTQDLVYQTSPQTLTQHLTNLIRVVSALERTYGSEGYPNVASAYSQMVALLSAMRQSVPTNYDDIIGIPRAVFQVHIVPDQPVACGTSGNLLAGTSSGTADAAIGGSFTSYEPEFCELGQSAYLYFSGTAEVTEYGIVYVNFSPESANTGDLSVTSGYCSGSGVGKITGDVVSWALVGLCYASVTATSLTFTVSSCTLSASVAVQVGSSFNSDSGNVNYC